MDEKEVPVRKWAIETITEGEWAGWYRRVLGDTFESSSGPYYFRNDLPGGLRMAFRAEQRHMNGGGFMHGGCLMTFADACLFSFARAELKNGYGVTATLNGEFMGSAHVGDLIQGTGEVIKAGGSLIFVRGIVTGNDAPLLTYSGVIKKVKPRG